MPGLENRSSKQETGLVHERKKEQLGKNVKVNQTIRVIYSDPDATDCSSDDENEGWNKMNSCSDGAERLVKEVCVIRNTSRKDGNGRGTSKHAGVRRRPWGKWVAEIRDPFTGKKNWLGIFLTEGEAVLAYQKKKLEFDNYNRNIGVMASSETSTCEEINTNVIISLPSPSSVLNQPDEPVISCANSVYFGNYVEHFFDDVRVEDLPMGELNDVGVMEIPTIDIDIDISRSDIAWIDELLNTSAL